MKVMKNSILKVLYRKMFADRWIRKFTIVKTVILSKLIYKFKAIQIIILTVFLIKIEKLILKSTWKYEDPRILKKNKAGD